MEDMYNNKWNTNRYLNYTGNPNLEYNRDSSGSRWGDVLAGLGQAGLIANPHNQPAQNFMDINYVGNGLARSEVKPLQNFNYQNPYLLGEYWKNNMRKNRYQFSNQDNNNELGDVFNNVNQNKILGNIGVGNFVNGSYPASIYDDIQNSNDIYNYTAPEFLYPTYLDGGNYGNFGKTVLDYFGTNNNIGGI